MATTKGWDDEAKVKSCLSGFIKDSTSTSKISSKRMKNIVSLALSNLHEYKRLVHAIETWTWKSKNMGITGLYIIDAIIKASIGKLGRDKDPYASRFLKRLETTVDISSKSSAEKTAKILNEWIKKGVFKQSEILPRNCIRLLEKYYPSKKRCTAGGLLPDPKRPKTEQSSKKELEPFKEPQKERLEPPKTEKPKSPEFQLDYSDEED